MKKIQIIKRMFEILSSFCCLFLFLIGKNFSLVIDKEIIPIKYSFFQLKDAVDGSLKINFLIYYIVISLAIIILINSTIQLIGLINDNKNRNKNKTPFFLFVLICMLVIGSVMPDDVYSSYSKDYLISISIFESFWFYLLIIFTIIRITLASNKFNNHH